MNFFNNKLSAKKYFNILKKYKATFSNKFVIQNFGAFMGDKSFYKLLTCFELLKKTKKIKGDIVEFGVWNGNNLFNIKKILDFLNIKKKVIGYDHFKGMPKHDKKNFFKGQKKFINYIINFYKLNNIKIIDDDIMNLSRHLRSFPKLSLIYVDCDLYNTTEKILKVLSGKLSVGGLITFDEGNFGNHRGEAKALNQFYSKNKKKYKKVFLKKFYQPDVYLQKISQ